MKSPVEFPELVVAVVICLALSAAVSLAISHNATPEPVCEVAALGRSLGSLSEDEFGRLLAYKAIESGIGGEGCDCGPGCGEGCGPEGCTPSVIQGFNCCPCPDEIPGPDESPEIEPDTDEPGDAPPVPRKKPPCRR